MSDQNEYYSIRQGTGTLIGHESIIAPDGFECFHFPGIVGRLNEQRERIAELEAEIAEFIYEESHGEPPEGQR